jgi:hypothetical protein
MLLRELRKLLVIAIEEKLMRRRIELVEFAYGYLEASDSKVSYIRVYDMIDDLVLKYKLLEL